MFHGFRRHSSVNNESGNVAVIFALTLVPMVGITGLAIDVSRTLSTKAVLDAAADAAALSAATYTMSTLQSPSGAGTAGLNTALYAGQLAGQQIFNTNASKVNGGVGAAPTSTITVAKNNQVITATATYTSSVPTMFGRMFGTRTMALNGKATTNLTLPSYMNISVAIDISQSMGIAATTAGITQLQGLTGGCAFGCHVYQPGQRGLLPYDQVAANAGIPLRIDVIRGATTNMIQTAQSLQSGVPLISFGLYTMQYGLTMLAPPSTSYTTLLKATSGITLGPNNSSGVGDSNFAAAMPTLTATVPASGDGSTAASPQQFVFLMTDGVQDVYGGCTDGHCTQAFDPAQCKALKDKGVTIGVIYTTYLPLPGEQTYTDLVAPFAANLAPNLKSCATTGWFYQATNAADIQVAVNALFNQATGHAILTQ